MKFILFLVNFIIITTKMVLHNIKNLDFFGMKWNSFESISNKLSSNE